MLRSPQGRQYDNPLILRFLMAGMFAAMGSVSGALSRVSIFIPQEKTMLKKIAIRAAAITIAAASLNIGLITPSIAREGNSIGGGVKCYWVLVSSANGVNSYQQVCRKGI